MHAGAHHPSPLSTTWPSAPRPAVQVIVVGFARGAVRMHALEDGEQRWRSHGHRDDVTALVVRARGAN